LRARRWPVVPGKKPRETAARQNGVEFYPMLFRLENHNMLKIKE
jgi:hypothetical protein